MQVSAVVTKDELDALVATITPLCVNIDARRGRRVTIGTPQLELVPRRGLRIRGRAKVDWDLAGVGIQLVIESWQLMLEPRLLARRPFVLSFRPSIEGLDLKHVPGIVASKIVDASGSAMARSQQKLAWDFGRTLSKRIPLPSRLELRRAAAGGVDLVPVSASAEVTASALHLGVELALRAREAPPRSEPPRALPPRQHDGDALTSSSGQREGERPR